MSTVQEIERAIDSLTPNELAELYAWLDQKHPQAIDIRLASDLESGRLDDTILRALGDEEAGRFRPL